MKPSTEAAVPDSCGTRARMRKVMAGTDMASPQVKTPGRITAQGSAGPAAAT